MENFLNVRSSKEFQKTSTGLVTKYQYVFAMIDVYVLFVNYADVYIGGGVNEDGLGSLLS